MAITANWRTFRIRPVHDYAVTEAAEDFYAPDLNTAFALARSRWPMACAWEAL